MCRVPCYGYLIAPERRAYDLDTLHTSVRDTVVAKSAQGWRMVGSVVGVGGVYFVIGVSVGRAICYCNSLLDAV